VRHHPLGTNYHLIDRHKVFSGSTASGVLRSYRRIAPGDADYAWTPEAGVSDIDYTTTLTANRTVTLGTSTAEDGVGLYVRRTAGGAFTLDVGGIITLAPDEWCYVIWNGSSYVPFASGQLGTTGHTDRGATFAGS
jgi:hypothetical protein